MLNEKIFSKITTPAYVYHEKILRKNLDILKNTISPYAGLFYSMKANPQKYICHMMNKSGLGIEVASGGELRLALEAGVNPNDIIFTSPGKTEKELEYAIEKKIKYINIDSYEEAEIINRIGINNNQVIKLIVRVNPAVSFSHAKIKMSGVSSQFGIEEEQLGFFLKKIKKLNNIQIVGFHIYMGTQMLLAEDIEKNTDYALNLFLDIAKKYNLSVEMFDVGGGFGVQYFENEKELDLVDLKNRLHNVFEKYAIELKGIRIMFESGRFLTAQAGEFIAKVLYVKYSKGIKYVICDGGSNFHSSAAFLGRYVRGNFPITTYPIGDETEVTTITGPLCTPLDVIGQKVEINSAICPGQYVIIENSGAYGLTYSPLHFLSHDMPMEYMDIDGDVIELR